MDELETKSKPAEQGDMIVARNNNGIPAEQYLIKANKFPKLYELPAVKDLGDWKIYNVKPEIRNVFFWTNEIANDFCKYFPQNRIASQEEFLEFAKNQKTLQCKKHSTVLAKGAAVGEIVITRVGINNKPISIIFDAPWNEQMPVKEGDAILVKEDEVYRIAKAEFNMTYELI